jgi:hypothetical protein
MRLSENTLYALILAGDKQAKAVLDQMLNSNLVSGIAMAFYDPNTDRLFVKHQPINPTKCSAQ